MALPIIGDVIDAVGDVVSEVVIDVDKKREIELELEKIKDAAETRLSNERLAQIDVNKEQSKSASIFVAGARPATMWVGVIGLLYAAVLYPTMKIFVTTAPVLDTDVLVYILGGLLGLSGMRTYEKTKGVATNDLTTGGSSPPTLPEDAPWTK